VATRDKTMPKPGRILLRWDEITDVVISVEVYTRGRVATGEEWRLANEITDVIWATWHLAGMETPSE